VILGVEVGGVPARAEAAPGRRAATLCGPYPDRAAGNVTPGAAARDSTAASGSFCRSRYLRRVSTRTLLILAALTGLAILVAFAVQVLLVA
jgi:hypothetical protein